MILGKTAVKGPKGVQAEVEITEEAARQLIARPVVAVGDCEDEMSAKRSRR